MPRRETDTARLEGDELRRWYLRSPAEIEQERQAAAARRYENFFGGNHAGGANARSAHEVPRQSAESSEDTLWIANGSGGYRAIRPGSQQYFADEEATASTYPADLPNSSAAPEGGELFDIGNPHNPRLRREWEGANGKSWPRTTDGRRFHVSHKVAIADGGTNTLENIEPMHPEEHIAHHMRNGDFRRWGLRATPRSTAGPGIRGGGTVMRGLGMLGILPTITGILSGRIKLGNDPIANTYHMFGYPAPDEVPEEPLIA